METMVLIRRIIGSILILVAGGAMWFFFTGDYTPEKDFPIWLGLLLAPPTALFFARMLIFGNDFLIEEKTNLISGLIALAVSVIFFGLWGYELANSKVDLTNFFVYFIFIFIMNVWGFLRIYQSGYDETLRIPAMVYAFASLAFVGLIAMKGFFNSENEFDAYFMNFTYPAFGVLLFISHERGSKLEDGLFSFFVGE